jgi:GNAT superfamily N-acetyltransferase
MHVIKVDKKADLQAFIRLPSTIFKDNPCYVPPIWQDEMKNYSAKANPILANSDYQLLLALNDRAEPVGRIVAYVDHAFNQFSHQNIGFFGSFECIQDGAAGRMLIQSAEEWLLGRGVASIRGPINPVAENWGFVWEGYAQRPVYLSPWNPPYYHDFFTGYGYEKTKDLLVYEGDILKGYRLPGRFAGFSERFSERYPEVTMRRLNMRRIKDDARAIWEISNLALAHNWGYVPLELAVMEDMLKKLKLIVDPDAVWMAEYKGNPIGFCLGFPDINVILQQIGGRLFPLGWLRLLLGVKGLRDYRLFGLAVHPDWQGKGIDALMYINLFNSLAAKKVRMEANYILEDNLRIKHALEKLGLVKIKTYRIYEKTLAD